MMEESSDESGEMISKEEAEVAELEHKTAAIGMTQSDISSPAPLPSFIREKSPGGTMSGQGGTVAPMSPPAPLPSFIRETSPGGALLTQGTTQVPMSVSSVPAPPKTQTIPQVPVSPQMPPVQPPPTSISAPMPQPQAVKAPGHIESPIEVSSSIQIPESEMTPISPQSPDQKGGLFGWFSGNKMISKVVEKTKSSMENMITIMDPGMKEVIRTGGDICIAVTSTKESKVGAIREAFQQTFGKAVVMGKESQATTAAQPVGFTAGLKGAEERIQNLRRSGAVDENQAIVSVEGFIIEMLPDRWYEMSCLVLQDPVHRIDLQSFSQPSPIPAEYILKAQDRTPADYPLRWLGLAVTIGQVIEEALPHIGHSDWQNAIVGVSRRESLLLAAKSLAYMYKQRLPTAFVS